MNRRALLTRLAAIAGAAPLLAVAAPIAAAASPAPSAPLPALPEAGYMSREDLLKQWYEGFPQAVVPDPLLSESWENMKATQRTLGQIEGHRNGFSEGYDFGREIGRTEVEQLSAPAAVVTGALFDFMGYLTTRDQPITLSRHHEVYDLMEAYKAWSEERGLDDRGADVLGWQERLDRDG